MTTNKMNPVYGQPRAPKASVLGIIFFLLGAPHVYGALRRRSAVPEQFNGYPYAAVVLLAGMIAAVVELSLL